MAGAERVLRCDTSDSGLVFDGLAQIKTVLFQQITRELSFAHFKQPKGDIGGRVECSKHCIVTAVGYQPNQIWDAGEGQTHHDNVQDFDNFIYLADRPTYVCNEAPFEFLVLFLDPSYLQGCAHESLDPDRVELLGQGCLRDSLLSGALSTLRREYKQHGALDRLYTESIVTALCVHILRNYTTLRPSLPDLTERGLGKALLSQALAYISDHLNEDLGLDEIAACVHLSTFHFSRLFKQSTGQAPRQYVIGQRVEKAKTLLTRSRLSVGEVAQAVGFYDHAHLIRHFKRSTGVTPNDFRR